MTRVRSRAPAAPAIRPAGLRRRGRSLVTAGGVVSIGATNDKRFRACDKDTAKRCGLPGCRPAARHDDDVHGKEVEETVRGGRGPGEANKCNKDYPDAQHENESLCRLS